MQNNFPELIVSRDKAIGVNAPKMDLNPYEKGNKLFLKVASDVGDGKIEKARNKAQDAVKNFKTAELEAIQQNMVGALNKNIEQAEDEGARKWAPETFKTAEKYRDEALNSLAEDRYHDQLAQAKIDQGEYYTRKAMFLTRKIKESKGDKANWEKLFLQREADLNQIASSLGVSPEFDKGFQEPVSEIDQSINDLKGREQAFNRALSHKDQALSQAEQQIRQAERARAQAEQQIRQAEQTRQRITAEMQRTMQQQQTSSSEKLKRVQALFSPNDAQVKLDPDNNITIVLRSLNFDTGKSVLKPEHYQLVANVKQVMDMFPNQKVMITGHTDFTGSSEFNKQLSLQRAKSVTQYLKSLGVEDTRLKSFGAGEADPIAPNNTPEGRRLNRRIEVTILSR
jgi:outer membrane protein OmpA-like peptidoglycan-associated protein